MPARTPDELNGLFAAAVNAGDLEALVDLYEPGASLCRPGQMITGRAAIRDTLRAILDRKPQLTVTPKPTVYAGDLALTASHWSMTGTAPDGARFTRHGISAEVARLQPDGTWRLVIDNPFIGD